MGARFKHAAERITDVLDRIIRALNKQHDFFRACEDGDKRRASRLLKSNPRLVNSRDEGFMGWTALHKAVKRGNLDIAKFVIERGADTNAMDRAQMTPLILACFCTQEDIVEYLLSKGPDMNAQDERGMTALHWAAHLGSVKNVRLLVESGADGDIRSNKGETPLQRIERSLRNDLKPKTRRRYETICEILRRHGAE